MVALSQRHEGNEGASEVQVLTSLDEGGFSAYSGFFVSGSWAVLLQISVLELTSLPEKNIFLQELQW